MKNSKIKIIWPNNIETFVSEGDDWFSSAEKVGLEIPTGCLTGSCGACEIDVNGKTVRACISDIKSNKNSLLKVSLTTDPFWEN
ncbi:MAG: 2Fe-2S iron-sulfur cluster binding domain-containing protein [Prochlorococcus marinus XMU1428]|nr:2Fe-2S iron-sulfur cluster binding domain-containing protein [Prochlorococcus marinus XMU1428]